MTAIVGFAIDSYRGGRTLVYVAKDGAIDVLGKEGPVSLPYKAGDVVLADSGGKPICGPVGVGGAIELAERVLNGEERYVTDPLALLVLAAAVCGFMGSHDDVDPLRSGAREAA